MHETLGVRVNRRVAVGGVVAIVVVLAAVIGWTRSDAGEPGNEPCDQVIALADDVDNGVVGLDEERRRLGDAYEARASPLASCWSAGWNIAVPAGKERSPGGGRARRTLSLSGGKADSARGRGPKTPGNPV
jgi:hypothetical protein